MQLSVITPHRKLLDSEPVEQVLAPGAEGQLDILPDYANFVTSLRPGVLRWRNGASWKAAAISFGWMEILDQHITVLADVSEMGTEIDMARARKAHQEAQFKISEGGLDDVSQRKHELKLARATARLEAGSLK